MRRRKGGAVALVVGLLVAGALNAIRPGGLDNLWHTVTAPDTADAGSFRVTIDDPAEDVIVARAVSNGFRSHETEHRLVLAVARYEFLRADTVINDVRLVTTDGHAYDSLTDYDVTQTRLPPGFQSSGIVVFEVPEDRVDGATLEFCRTAIIQDRFDCARIEGAVTPDTVRHLDGVVTLDPADLTYEVIGR